MAAQLGTQAVDRAAALAAVVVRAGQPCSFSSLVAEVGLPKSTASRLLQSLERNGLLHRDGAGSFRPGPLFTAYAAGRDLTGDLVELARPALDLIAHRTGETVNLGVPDGVRVVHAAQVNSRYLLGTTNWTGVDVPAHCTALGKVFYAYGALPLPRGPLLPRTKRTLTSVADLRRHLAEVRRRGWAVARDELEVGLVAVAAPVRARDDRVVAAVSVSGPTSRITRAAVSEIGALLVEETTALSGLLGSSNGREGVA